MEINQIRKKIQSLRDKATSDNERQKKILKFLFEKKEEVKELETIDRLQKFQGGNKYLQAYLLYKSIARSNYQLELIKHANYETDDGYNKLLGAIAHDIEQWEKDNNDRVPAEKLSNRQLLMMLSEGLRNNEIKRELTFGFGNYLITETEQGLLKVDLKDGKLTPNPAEKLLKKHGFKNER